jgi:hypothetical protein
MRIETTITGDKELNDIIAKLERLSIDGVKRAMQYSVIAVEAMAKQLSPVNTGRLATSITSVVEGSTENITGRIGTNVVYAPYMELGTKPHFPPIAAIQDWVKKKGIAAKLTPSGKRGGSKATRESQDRSMAFVIARSISKKGTRERPYLVPALEKSGGRVYKYFEDEIRAINKNER